MPPVCSKKDLILGAINFSSPKNIPVPNWSDKGARNSSIITPSGNVISSGTNYALDSISGAVDIDPRDLNNIKQYLGGQTLPASLQRMTRSSTALGHETSGQLRLTGKVDWQNKIKARIDGRLLAADDGTAEMKELLKGDDYW